MMEHVKKGYLRETLANHHQYRVHEFDRLGEEIIPQSIGNFHFVLVGRHGHSLTEEIVSTTVNTNDNLEYSGN